ncbi:solute carrier family 2, facilitated glucose transporter member 10 [Spea bombifrons]|uniref:solute carrier family 2, facilitated glucose transporter member 10 n=1 Tax=Spea bombifrons TaxID=233779 RepID=UPI00234AF321|nr:solute carrier family 2, facilitated glucose transporter member 10 [Spea bombifrons]XP_053309281.1 solute carrier family 2, facilitated glucose transporter member 10 [Spea bombifrons]
MGVSSATLVLAAAVSTLGGLIFGYELGIISGALLQLKNALYLTCAQQEVLVGALLVGALLASLFGGFVIDRSGRRTSILGSNVVVLVGSLILIVSNSFWWLVVGRVVIGVAIAISSMACCIYVSEIVRPHQRGMLVTLYEMGVTVGILVSYAMNYFLSNLNMGWKYMFGLAISPAAIQFISILFLPSKSTDRVFIEMQDIEDDGKPNPPKRHFSFFDLFKSKNNMRSRTLAGLGLLLFQQFTGQPNVLYYASTIFHSVGFQSDSSALLASVGLGVVKVLSTLVALSCADRAGRRILLIAGCLVMTASLTGIGILCFNIELDSRKDCEFLSKMNPSQDLSNSSLMFPNAFDGATTRSRQTRQSVSVTRELPPGGTGNRTTLTSSSFGAWSTEESLPPSKDSSKFRTTRAAGAQPLNDHVILNWITLLSMMTFVSAFSIGFGPMTWLVLSEIFPEGIRGRAFAFCNSFNWAANLLVSLSFLDVIDSIGLPWTFLLYGMMGVFATIFIYYFIPETKGRSLDEIDKEFSSTRFTKGNAIWENVGRRSLSDPKYEIMGRSNTSVSSASTSS